MADLVKIEFDFNELALRAMKLGASVEQIPYAVARTLNDAAEATRSFLISDTWPKHVAARNASFMKASLTTKDARANKSSLVVEIYDRLDRGNLVLQEKGGSLAARGGSRAIPARVIKRGAHGVPKSQRPKNLKNTFKSGSKLMQRVGKGKNQKVRLVYTLKPVVRIKPRVPFHRDFATIMEREVRAALPKNVEIAMRTAR